MLFALPFITFVVCSLSYVSTRLHPLFMAGPIQFKRQVSIVFYEFMLNWVRALHSRSSFLFQTVLV